MIEVSTGGLTQHKRVIGDRWYIHPVACQSGWVCVFFFFNHFIVAGGLS